MKPPKHKLIYETPIAIYWLDEDGFLCSNSKDVERTIEYCKVEFDLFKKIMKGNKKLCLLSDVTNLTTPINQEARKFVTNEMPKYIKVNALISTTQMGNTQSMTLIKLVLAGFPIQMFSNEDEAKEWLKTYLEL